MHVIQWDEVKKLHIFKIESVRKWRKTNKSHWTEWISIENSRKKKTIWTWFSKKTIIKCFCFCFEFYFCFNLQLLGHISGDVEKMETTQLFFDGFNFFNFVTETETFFVRFVSFRLDSHHEHIFFTKFQQQFFNSKKSYLKLDEMKLWK